VCAPELLADGGTILIVHSEFADIDRTIEGLRAGRLRADVVAEQWIRSARCSRRGLTG
jgi:release factor glutamine methyltransferase